MKIALKAAEYTFAPGSNSVTFNVTGFDVRSLLYVANIATRTDLYVVADQALGSVTVNGSTVTFPVAMAGMTATDPLLILYDDRIGAQAVSAVSLPLPTGAATSAKQPALGTAGTPSTDVITIQGIASGVPQPVSGTVSAAQSGAWSFSLSGTAAVTQSGSWTVAATQSGTWTANALGSQYNSTLPTLANGANAYLAVDINGRVLLSPTSVLNVYPVGTYNSTAPSLTNGGQTATQVSPNGSMFVDLSRSSVIGSATGGTAATASLLGGGVYNSTPPTVGNGQQVGLQVDANGNLKVTAVGGGTSSGSITAAGTNGTQAQAVQGIVGGVALPVIQAATAAANAVLESRVASAASTNATSLKTSAGNIVGIEVYNLATSVRYLKIYNKASAPTVGTDTPTWTIPLPAGGGFSWEPQIPRTFATGLAYAITGAVADSDTTAVAVNDVVGVIRYL